MWLWHAPADKGTGKKQDIKITGASTLAGDEVDRMVKEAEKFAEEDKKKREAVDIQNQVRAMQLRSCSVAAGLQLIRMRFAGSE
jgi:molecular chaperone DnaK (HSP70)